MPSTRIKGGPQLKARLAAIPAGAPGLVGLWAEDAASLMRQNAPASSRPASRKFEPRTRGLRGAVYGAYWWIFVDRGTKRHVIYGAGAKNPPEILRFSRGGRTIFAKKVNHPGQRRRAFITRSAQDAFSSSALHEGIVKLWNRRRIGSRKAFL
jgi:hypothetical protein